MSLKVVTVMEVKTVMGVVEVMEVVEVKSKNYFEKWPKMRVIELIS
jgi:hypothetical protein